MEDSKSTNTQITDLEEVVLKVLQNEKLASVYDETERRTEHFRTKVTRIVDKYFHRNTESNSYEEIADALAYDYNVLQQIDLSGPTIYPDTPAYMDLSIMIDDMLQDFIVAVEEAHGLNSPRYHLIYNENGSLHVKHEESGRKFAVDGTPLRRISSGFNDAYGRLESYITQQGHKIGLNDTWTILGAKQSPAKTTLIRLLQDFFTRSAKPYVQGLKKPSYQIRGNLTEEQEDYRLMINKFMNRIHKEFVALYNLTSDKDKLWDQMVNNVIIYQVLAELPLLKDESYDPGINNQAGEIHAASLDVHGVPTVHKSPGVHVKMDQDKMDQEVKSQHPPVDHDAGTMVLNDDHNGGEQDSELERCTTGPYKKIGTVFGLRRRDPLNEPELYARRPMSINTGTPTGQGPAEQPPARSSSDDQVKAIIEAEPPNYLGHSRGREEPSIGEYSIPDPQNHQKRQGLYDIISAIRELEVVKLGRYELEEKMQAINKARALLEDDSFLLHNLSTVYKGRFSADIDPETLKDALFKFGGQSPKPSAFGLMENHTEQQAAFDAPSVYPFLSEEEKLVVGVNHAISTNKGVNDNETNRALIGCLGKYMYYEYTIKGLPNAERFIEKYEEVLAKHLSNYLALNRGFFKSPQEFSDWLGQSPAASIGWRKKENAKAEEQANQTLELSIKHLEAFRESKEPLPVLLRNRYTLRNSLLLYIWDSDSNEFDVTKADSAVQDMQGIINHMEGYASVFKVDLSAKKIDGKFLGVEGFEDLMANGRSSRYFNKLDLSEIFLVDAMRTFDAYQGKGLDAEMSKRLAIDFATLLCRYVTDDIPDAERKRMWQWNVYKDVSDLLGIKATGKGMQFKTYNDIPEFIESYVNKNLKKRVKILNGLIKDSAMPTGEECEKSDARAALEAAEDELDALLGDDTSSSDKPQPSEEHTDEQPYDSGAIEIPAQFTNVEDKLGGVPDGSGMHAIRRIKTDIERQLQLHDEGLEADITARLDYAETVAELLPVNDVQEGPYRKEDLGVYQQFVGIESSAWKDLTENLHKSPFFAILSNGDGLRLKLTHYTSDNEGNTFNQHLIDVGNTIADHIYAHANMVRRSIDEDKYPPEHLSLDISKHVADFAGDADIDFEVLGNALVNYQAGWRSTIAALKTSLGIETPEEGEEAIEPEVVKQLQPEASVPLDEKDIIEETEEEKQARHIAELEQIISDAEDIKNSVPGTRSILQTGFELVAEARLAIDGDDETLVANDLQSEGRDSKYYPKLMLSSNKLYTSVIFQATEYITGADSAQVILGISEVLAQRMVEDAGLQSEEGDISRANIRDTLYDLIDGSLDGLYPPHLNEDEIIKRVISSLDQYEKSIAQYADEKRAELDSILNPPEPEEPEAEQEQSTSAADESEYDLAGLVMNWIPPLSDVEALSSKEPRWNAYRSVLERCERQLPQGSEKIADAFDNMGHLVAQYLNNVNIIEENSFELPKEDYTFIADQVEAAINKMWIAGYIAFETTGEGSSNEDAVAKAREKFNRDSIDCAIRQFRQDIEEQAITDGLYSRVTDSMVEEFPLPASAASADEPHDTEDTQIGGPEIAYGEMGHEEDASVPPEDDKPHFVVQPPPMPATAIGTIKIDQTEKPAQPPVVEGGSINNTIAGIDGPVSPTAQTFQEDTHSPPEPTPQPAVVYRELDEEEQKVSLTVVEYLHMKFTSHSLITEGDTPQVKAQLAVDVQKVLAGMPANRLEREVVLQEELTRLRSNHPGLDDLVTIMQKQYELSESDAKACAYASCKVIASYESKGVFDPDRAQSYFSRVQEMEQEKTPRPARQKANAESPEKAGASPAQEGSRKSPVPRLPDGIKLENLSPGLSALIQLCYTMDDKKRTRQVWVTAMNNFFANDGADYDFTTQQFYAASKIAKKAVKDLPEIMIDAYERAQLQRARTELQLAELRNKRLGYDLRDKTMAQEALEQRVNAVETGLVATQKELSLLGQSVQGVADNVSQFAKAQTAAQERTNTIIHSLSETILHSTETMQKAADQYEKAVVVQKKEPEPERKPSGLMMAGLIGVTALITGAAIYLASEKGCNGCNEVSKRNDDYIGPSQPGTDPSQPKTGTTPGMDYGTPMSPMDAMKAGHTKPSYIHSAMSGMRKPMKRASAMPPDIKVKQTDPMSLYKDSHQPMGTSMSAMARRSGMRGSRSSRRKRSMQHSMRHRSSTRYEAMKPMYAPKSGSTPGIEVRNVDPLKLVR